MLYNDFQSERLSALGFGAMRLPLLGDGSIDQAELDRMVDAAMAAGVNYYDTAHPYHGGMSEGALCKALKRYPRESWNLADKFPGHQNVPGVKPLQPKDIFEEQLQRCGVDYFDFYLLHNVNENSMSYYGHPENGFMEYFLEQKQKGRIRHLGFSCHAAPAGLEKFLDLYDGHMEFCQIQLNYVDWTLQDAKRKVAILRERGIPVWVMEPVRGGKLAAFDEETEASMRSLRPDESIPAWAFRWLRTVPQPTMILSGMSSLAQMQDNLKTFSEHKPLNDTELQLIEALGLRIARQIPCTGCRYCCAGCPMELDIPMLMGMANDMAITQSFNTVSRYAALDESKKASACIGCGQCSAACPQKIDVPEQMRRLTQVMANHKSWEEICRERAEAAEAARKQK